MSDLDPTLRRSVDLAAAEIPVPPRRGTRKVARRRSVALAIGVAALVLIIGSSAAVATGLFSEVFRIGNVSAVASRRVSLDEARVARVPLPKSDTLPFGWRLAEVHLTMPPDWRSVDLQYRRPGARGLGITVWSEGITVKPNSGQVEHATVAGVPVEIGRAGDGITAKFAYRGATIILRAFASEVTDAELRTILVAWLDDVR